MNTQINFTIHGNQEDPTGNAIPYLRTTQKSQWTDKAKRYANWKDFVRAAYLDAVLPLKKISREEFADYHDVIQKKPIKAKKDRSCMDILIYWKNDAHADPDNIFKGIADALFENDKYLVGSFDYIYCEYQKGRVEVTITL